MRRTTLVYIGVATFLGCWVLLFSLPCIIEDCPLSELVQLTKGASANFILLALLFGLISVVLPLAVDLVHSYLLRFKPFRPKLGDILIRRGYITEEQLAHALAIQKLRTGELLLYFGHITETQLEDALRMQKQGSNKRIGELLSELGYVAAHDIQWALVEVHQKLGKILEKQGLIGSHELHTVLGRQWYSRHLGGL